eukprot:TRINITY_DN18990_c0_g1_i1.p1 TRINITY_DN18990_c0_g1~~TRINITY_DN18990_c0_g1_i1.p1  ORF type:complete len:239 (-),score=38.22 TRINITY_DN18990_c0_g1_i1:225-941(-)
MAKYPWGDVDFPTKFLPFMFLYATIMTTLLVKFGPHSDDAMTAMKKDGAHPIMVFKGLILVTIGWCAVYFSTITLALQMRFGPDKLKSSEIAASVGGRVQANMLEQAWLFIIPFCLHFIFVDSDGAYALGAYWLFFRILYGCAFTSVAKFSILLEFTTQPQYAALGNLVVGILFDVFRFPDKWTDLVAGSAGFWVPPLAYFGWGIFWMNGSPFGLLWAKILEKGIDVQEGYEYKIVVE